MGESDKHVGAEIRSAADDPLVAAVGFYIANEEAVGAGMFFYREDFADAALPKELSGFFHTLHFRDGYRQSLRDRGRRSFPEANEILEPVERNFHVTSVRDSPRFR
jgi:hypothetical protein